MNISARIEKLEIQRRRRTIMRCRLYQGVLNICEKPWKLMLIIALTIMFLLTWNKRDSILLPGDNNVPELMALWRSVVSLIIVLIYIALSVWLLVTIGTPLRSKKVDASLAHIKLVDCYCYPPALLAIHKVGHTDIERLTFYSRGISKELWEKRQQAIEDVLNVHWVESPKYGGRNGNNRNYIVLTVAPGVQNIRDEPLYDEEL